MSSWDRILACKTLAKTKKQFALETNEVKHPEIPFSGLAAKAWKYVLLVWIPF
jgi:hypothetical protein